MLLLISFCQVAAPQQSVKGQQPEESAKRTSTHREEKDKSTPTPQIVVIQANQEPASHQENQQPKTENATKHPHDWIDRLNAFSTLVIALFTIGMVIVIGIQIREYRIRERAWVTFLLPEKAVVQKTKGGQPDGYRIVGCIKNIGNTPATIVRKFHFKSVLEPGEDFQATPPYLDTKESQTEYLMIPGAIEPAIVEIEEHEVLNLHQLRIHVLGQVVYRDVFGKPHETRYCLRYYPQPTADRQPGFYPEGPSAYLKVT
ncbi:MAG: hypothetical protein WB799_18525 [Candidatus Sulfotelmatobacter sp.]